MAELTSTLESEREGHSNRLASTADLEAQNRVSQSTITNLQKMIAQLEETKAELDEEMNEATDAIAMLEDELDRKDGQVKELLIKLTMLQQQFSQSDKCKTALAERNAKLSSENDDLNTQIKVLIIEKKITSEENETLKTMKTIADEDQEDQEEKALMHREKQKQEVDKLLDRIEEVRLKCNEKVLKLEQEVYQLEETNAGLEENLEESSDAIAVLREALGELEEGKVSRNIRVKELETTLAERERDLRELESDRGKLRSEHQVSVDTISTLQKMIASLETSKEDLEDELNESSMELSNVKDQLKNRNSLAEVTNLEREVRELEGELARSEENNKKLTKRIEELDEANERMKDEVKGLGESLANVTASRNRVVILSKATGTSGGGKAGGASASGLVSSDPVASCDALLSELKNQIKEIVSARNAALEEVEMLRSDASVMSSSELTLPPPLASGVESKLAAAAVEVPKEALVASSPSASRSASPLSESVVSGPEGDERTLATMEKSMAGKSSAISHAGSRGSSLLEAAKKLCNQLDEKRSRQEEINSEKSSHTSSNGSTATVPKTVNETVSRRSVSPPREGEPVKNVIDQEDDNSSAREVKEDLPKEAEKPEVNRAKSVSPTLTPPDEEKKEDINRAAAAASSRSKPRLDIDQLTSIYFEKCGMSVSRFSDLSSDSSSFRRRSIKAPADTVTKKVKICRNGVFMGTYEGDLNAEGQRHGFGVLLCDNGNSYEGEWKKDKRDGLGIARYSSGDVYDGQWQRGKRQGHGVMYIEAGDTYIGSWNNGLKHGAGTYHWADGEVDVSWYQEDRRVGEGVRWNASRSKAFRLIRGTKKEELSLDEAYMTAEKLGLNLEKFDAGVP